MKQQRKLKRIKAQKGITLIALVITIIILLILARVTISLIIGEHGLFNTAKDATEEHRKQTATEKINLKITNSQINTYAKEQRMPTLQELANDFCYDNEIEYVELASKKTASLKIVDIGEHKSFFTKLNDYPYEFEINSSLQLASIDGVKVAIVPENDDDTIVSMTKAELQELINTSINNNLKDYSKTTDISSTYATKKDLNKFRLGNIDFGILSSNGSSSKTITFSEPLDNDLYSVVVTCTSNCSYWASIQYTVQNKTANGFTIGAHNSAGGVTGASITANYIVIPYK